MDNSVLNRSTLRRSYMAEKGLCLNIQNPFESAETIVFKYRKIANSGRGYYQFLVVLGVHFT